MTEEEPKQDKYKKLKLVVDIISGCAVLIFFAILTWSVCCVPEAFKHKKDINPPILWVLIFDIVPFVFGGNWLIIRYCQVLYTTFPSFFARRNRPLVMLCAFLLGCAIKGCSIYINGE